tara:strand:- start:3394 stop:3852 length:459 start_codon:yes stop_codon:yes gene_type:complete
MSNNEEPIRLNSVKPTSKFKNKKTLFLLFLIVLVLTVMSAASFGGVALSFCLFYLFFGVPLLIIFSDTVLSLIPENIASYFINEVEEIQKEITIGKVNVAPIYNIDYLILFIGISTYLMSLYILAKQKHKLVGLISSLCLCSLSSIIIGDIF